MSFVDDLRRKYPELFQLTLFVRDTVGFLVEQAKLPFNVAHCCSISFVQLLCASTILSGPYHQSNWAQLIPMLPVQSFFRIVPNGRESFLTDQSIAALLRLEPTFVGIGTSCVYSSWNDVDFFGLAGFLEQLDPSGTCRPSQDSELTSKVPHASKPVKAKKSGVSKKMNHLLTKEELTQSAENLLSASSSKFQLYICTFVSRLCICSFSPLLLYLY